jgi:metal-dependent amidase/aminoacylase/carboxypeptidase family protein
MAQNMAAAFRCQASFETVAIVPAVENAAEPTGVVRQAAAAVVGPDNVIEGRTMGAEDMGFILQEIPGCYFFVGSGNEARNLSYPQHHPSFDFEERALVNGVATMLHAAAHYLV